MARPVSGDRWPSGPGTYALVLEAIKPLAVKVGRLGICHISPGCYVYVGSARGPGGLQARLARHLRPAKKIHWHIDALTAVLPVIDVIAVATPHHRECAWVQHLLALPGALPVAGFGSTDCRAGCPAHLLRLPGRYEPEAWGFIDEEC